MVSVLIRGPETREFGKKSTQKKFLMYRGVCIEGCRVGVFWGSWMAADLSAQRDAFEAEALPHAQTLYRVAYRQVRNPEAASDLVQETFLRAFRTFQNFKQGTNARAWLFTILYSILKNQARKHHREPLHQSMDSQDQPEPKVSDDAWGSSLSILRKLDTERVDAEIVDAVSQLSHSSRWLLLLVDVEDMSYEEAASVVGCPVGTISSRLYRARKQLFEKLQPLARRRGLLAQ